ncbi:MAG: helix-turn-helix transcriptional regulator [Puniceicoccales bacterium]
MKVRSEWWRCLNEPPEVVQLAYSVHGQHVERESFLLRESWALHFYRYEGELHVAGEVFPLQPGSVSLVPAGIPVTYVYRGRSEHLYAHFRLPATGQQLPERGFFFSPERRLDALRERFGQVVGYRVQEPARTNARLWDVLFGLATVARFPGERTAHMRLIDQAARICQQEMADCPTVAQLAGRCQVSHNQFIRILKRHTGLTPQAWLRKQRTDRARELLMHSDVPVKVVACEVGLPDLQHFNKVIRRVFGCSPRQLREKGN